MTASATATTRAARTRSAPQRRERPALRVVRPAARRHPVLFLILHLAAGIAIVMGAVSLNALAAADAIDVRELDATIRADERQYEQLVAEVAELEDPVRIRRIAEGMGMIPASSPRYLTPSAPLPGDIVIEDHDDPVKPVLTAQP